MTFYRLSFAFVTGAMTASSVTHLRYISVFCCTADITNCELRILMCYNVWNSWWKM